MQAIPVARTWRPYLWLVAGVLFLLMGACPIYFLVATDAPGAKWLIVVNIGVLLYLAIKAFALVYTRLTIFTDEGMWVPGLRGRQLVRWSEIGRVRKTWRTLVLYAGKRTTGVALEVDDVGSAVVMRDVCRQADDWRGVGRLPGPRGGVG